MSKVEVYGTTYEVVEHDDYHITIDGKRLTVLNNETLTQYAPGDRNPG